MRFCKAVEIEATGAPAVMAFCHCESCRTWLRAPIHGATLWPVACWSCIPPSA